MQASHVSDAEAIKTLTHRYGLAVDTFDLDGITAVFAADGVFDCTAFGLERLEGHDGIRRFFDHNQQAMASQIHLFANHIIEIDGPDEAHGTNYLLQDGYTKEGARIQCLGLNRDQYVRTRDGWLIKERMITPLVPPQLEGY
ncbi:MAG TPA: nuclear transport factor 2 family protein [Gaiellaceae bacterium]